MLFARSMISSGLSGLKVIAVAIAQDFDSGIQIGLDGK